MLVVVVVVVVVSCNSCYCYSRCSDSCSSCFNCRLTTYGMVQSCWFVVLLMTRL